MCLREPSSIIAVAGFLAGGEVNLPVKPFDLTNACVAADQALPHQSVSAGRLGFGRKRFFLLIRNSRKHPNLRKFITNSF
jgi:hypothetical protein